MKKITVLMLAVLALGLFSCNNGNKEAQNDALNATVEAFGSDAVGSNSWVPGSKLVAWDDALAPFKAEVVSLTPDTFLYQLALVDSVTPQGVCRFLYPAEAYAGQGIVTVPVEQQGSAEPSDLICYAEAQDGKVDFKQICGVIQLNITTPEQLTCISISTEDSNRYLAGNFQVVNYPSPVLNSVEGAERHIDVHGIENIDFSKGADVCIQVVPGCYGSFQIVLQNKDGKICTKTLKEDKHVIVDRNRMLSVKLGHTPEGLTFE